MTKANKAKNTKVTAPTFTLQYQTPDREEIRRLERPTQSAIASVITRCGVDLEANFKDKPITKKYGFWVMNISHPYRQRRLSCQYKTTTELLELLKAELRFLSTLEN